MLYRTRTVKHNFGNAYIKELLGTLPSAKENGNNVFKSVAALSNEGADS